MNSNQRSRFNPREPFAILLAILLLVPTTWGCTIFRDPTPPGFDTISIQAEVERDRKANIEGDLNAFSTLRGVLVGAVVGGPTLAFTAGAVTLPIALSVCSVTAATLAAAILAYPVCVIGATLLATAGGFIVGLGGGIAYGAIGGLPSEVADQVTAVLSNFEGDYRFEDELLDVVRAAIPPEKQVEDGAADAVLTARLEKFELRQHSKDHLSIRLRAEMLQEWKNESGKSKKNACDYRYDSERKPAETWLADGGVPFREAVTLGLERIAQLMNRDLVAFANETELKKTDEDPKSCYRRKRWYDIFLLF